MPSLETRSNFISKTREILPLVAPLLDSEVDFKFFLRSNIDFERKCCNFVPLPPPPSPPKKKIMLPVAPFFYSMIDFVVFDAKIWVLSVKVLLIYFLVKGKCQHVESEPCGEKVTLPFVFIEVASSLVV